MKRILLIACVLLSVGVMRLYAQQDAQFSQYMFNGLYINPAYAGYKEQWNVNMFARTQWTGFPGAPKTISLAADGTAHDDRMGLGVMFVNDRLGAQNNTSFYGNYAYRLQLDDYDNKCLAMGFGLGVVNQHLQIDALNPRDQNDPSILAAKRSTILPDARVGIFYNSDRFYTGLSADNLITNQLQKNETLKTYIPLKTHIYFTMGGLVTVADQVKFKPSFLIKEDFAGPTSLDLNAFLLLNERVWVGGSYRTAIFNKSNLDYGLTKSGAVVGMIELFVNDKLRVGYSYDQTINGTAANRYTTHEISLNFLFPNARVGMLSPRYF